MSKDRNKRKNLLSIDGGISGLPALYILDEMISRLQFDLNSYEELFLWQYFDIIIATGPGALIAILIGRLRLPLSTAIEVYMKLTFALPAEPANQVGRMKNSEIFENTFKTVLNDAGFDSDAPLLDGNDPKVIICASNIANASVLFPIRSYRTRGALPPACSILQAACACVASPDKFAPIELGNAYRKAVIMDAMAGYANPIKELLREAQEVFGEDAEVSNLISIGAGKLDMEVSFNGEKELGINEALKRVSAMCEQVHEEMQMRLRGASIYNRFNVEKGMGTVPEVISARTSGYLSERAISDRLDEAIRGIQNRPKGVSIKDINSVNIIENTLKPRPPLVQDFVGRQEILDTMHRTHISKRSTSLHTPATTVLFGLGGSGKTQTALKFALEFENLYPDALVFFLNASSEESLKADLEMVIRSRGTAYRNQSFKDALSYLAKEIKDWLVILDNADDPSVRLFPYIPRCTYGNVIITTRNSNHSVLATNSSHHVEGLSVDEAVKLMLSTSRHEGIEANRQIAYHIVEELGCLPLAIAQAGGYIYVNRCFSTYLDIYRKNRLELLDSDELELPQDYQATVATTIRMSMDQLPPRAQDLMQLFAHLDFTSIPHEIIVKAAVQRFQWVTRTDEADVKPETSSLAATLMKVFCPDGEWSEVSFGKLINRCLQYSLVQLTSQGEGKRYSLHVLVQSYLHARQSIIDGHRPSSLVVRLLGSSATFSRSYEHMAFRSLLAPHLKLIEIRDIIEPGDHLFFGQVFQDVGDVKMTMMHREKSLEMWRYSMGEGHENTLKAMLDLASSYREVGNGQKALGMEEAMLETSRRLHGPEHPTTLQIMHNLTSSYNVVGRVQEALKLRQDVSEVRKRVLGPEHPDTLATMNNLANSYNTIGQRQKALELRTKVLEMRKKVIGPDHPDTLMTMNNLAISYDTFGRYQEALSLKEEVLERRNKVLGPEHPDTLTTMTNVAVSYWNIGRRTEASELERVVLEAQMRVLGNEHPNTLRTMRNRLITYRALGMSKEMHKLLELALSAHEKSLGRDHPETVKLRQRYK